MIRFLRTLYKMFGKYLKMYLKLYFLKILIFLILIIFLFLDYFNMLLLKIFFKK
jgi:hypothetical protein